MGVKDIIGRDCNSERFSAPDESMDPLRRVGQELHIYWEGAIIKFYGRIEGSARPVYAPILEKKHSWETPDNGGSMKMTIGEMRDKIGSDERSNCILQSHGAVSLSLEGKLLPCCHALHQLPRSMQIGLAGRLSLMEAGPHERS